MPPSRQGNVNTESVDNYLKAILALSGPDERRVSSTSLADRLGVAPASVTNMLQKLAAASVPFVEYERHRGVLLSAAGKRRALEVVRHHRLLETFLFEVLDYPIEEVHEEAERLEHFISERFEERIAAKLGHPKFDPHGHYIPTMEGKMPKQSLQTINGYSRGRNFCCGQRFGSGCVFIEAAQSPRHYPGSTNTGHKASPRRIRSAHARQYASADSPSRSSGSSSHPFCRLEGPYKAGLPRT